MVDHGGVRLRLGKAVHLGYVLAPAGARGRNTAQVTVPDGVDEVAMEQDVNSEQEVHGVPDGKARKQTQAN